MLNPFKLSDYFIPISNYIGRNRTIFWRKLAYAYKKKTYLEKIAFKTSYVNTQGYLEVSYAYENLIYAKIDDLYFFESEKKILVNLKNYPHKKFSIFFKGLKDQEEIIIELKDYILTDFEGFKQKIKLKNHLIIKMELMFSQFQIDSKRPIIYSNQFKINTANNRINTTKFNKENYVK